MTPATIHDLLAAARGWRSGDLADKNYHASTVVEAFDIEMAEALTRIVSMEIGSLRDCQRIASECLDKIVKETNRG